MGDVRPITFNDGPALADVHLRVFGQVGNTEEEVRRAYTPDHLSLVLEDRYVSHAAPSMLFEQDGAVIGFLLMICRPAKFHGNTVWIASSSHLAVDPDARASLAAIHLLRAIADGPQDITFVDRSNDAGRKSLRAAGFTPFPGHSLRWTRVMRPGAAVSKRIADRTGLDFLARAGSALDSATPAKLRDRLVDELPERPASITTQPLTIDHVVHGSPSLVSGLDLHPLLDDAEHIAHQWELLSSIYRNSQIIRNVLLSKRGDVVGWYIAELNIHGVAEVSQFIAKPQVQRMAFISMLHDLAETSATRIEGDLPPGLLHDIDDLGCQISTDMAGTSVRSNDPAVLTAFEKNRAWLSPLDGEMLLNPVASVQK